MAWFFCTNAGTLLGMPISLCSERSEFKMTFAVNPQICFSELDLIFLAAWLSGSTLILINEVTLCRAQLVLEWVTICGRANHLIL